MNEMLDGKKGADEGVQEESPPMNAAGAEAAPLTHFHPLLRILSEDFDLPAESVEEINQTLPSGPDALRVLRTSLVTQKLVTQEVYQEALARLFGLEFSPSLEDAEILNEFTKDIPIRYVKKFGFFPIHMDEEYLHVALEDPQNLSPVEDVGQRFGRSIKPVVSTHQAILTLINRAYDRNQGSTDQVIEDFDEGDVEGGSYDWGIEEPEDLIDARDEEPIKRLLNNVLYQAAKKNASDVHIDAGPSEVSVRFRVDGVLMTATTLPKPVQRPLINRIKIMSRLDIAQHGLPQDGRTLIVIAGRRIDIRVSTMPTVHGEKAVMRLLYQDKDLFDLRKLGMPEDVYAGMLSLIGTSGGIILVSGPTGSGKTTTLYAALSEIDRQKRNIMTIEDPVEYKLSGYVQTEVNPKVGLTFANALRSVLRQDPDVIMVGEMRDRETALIAIQAALTGHLVFSTVHTNDAASTITRLVDMGIEPYLVSSTVVGVLAQRLVRRICTKCRHSQPADPGLLKNLGLSSKGKGAVKEFFSGAGCPACSGTGYAGRIGLFELLPISDGVKKALRKSSEANIIRDQAISEGMLTMRTYGIMLIKEGLTTVEEVLQTTRNE